jgi:O-glycosyl hydrolase
MGSSGMRLGVIGNHVEEVNDNDDPFVLDMSKLNHAAFDWNYLRYLKANGVEKFILTLWSPPAWMKEGLSYSLVEQAIAWENTQNKVLPYMYDEYAENIVATIKLIKEEADIDVYAVCPQNEPAFNEPYESSILSPVQFVKFIRVLGPRLQAEGLNTKIYMPEQVYGQNFYSMSEYISTLNADPIATQFVDIIAVHGYGADGITPGIPDFSGWSDLYSSAHAGSHPKELWMTETDITYTSFADALKYAGGIHSGLRYGNISWWTNFGFQGNQITKNLPNSSFYTTKNYFKYIRPGAIRVGSSSTNPDVMEVAFFHPVNKTYTIVLINKASTANSVQLTGNNIPTKYKAFRTTSFENFVEIDSVKNNIFLLPPSSVTTLYATENSILAINAVDDQYIQHNAGPQQVALSGIDNGSGSTNGLSISVKSDNPLLIPDISVGSINADGTATLNYTPATDQNGDAKVTLTLTDGVGNSRELVFYIITGPTGIKTDAGKQLNIYPNPASNYFNLVVPATSFRELTITDLTGKLVYQQEINSIEMTINTSGLDKGLYFVKISGNNQSIVSKLVIQ